MAKRTNLETKFIGSFTGTVIKYDVERSFGFISVDCEEIKDDAFIYYTDIEPEKEGFKKLRQDQIVSFELYKKTDLVERDGEEVSEINYAAKNLLIGESENGTDEFNDNAGNN
jgi:cold shock CspA family protein